VVLAMLQVIFLLLLWGVGWQFALGWPYQFSLVAVMIFSGYQQWLLAKKTREAYFSAFLNHQWIGLVVFFGIFFSFLRAI